MQLYFPILTLPRTIGREEWYKLWHWKRTTIKKLAEQDKMRAELLKNKKMPKKIRDDIMDELIYPPLLLGPHMDKSK